jgi:putative heme-binding domain-containing protein
MQRQQRYIAASFVAVVFLHSVFAQRDAKIPDPDPEIERKTFQLPPGFEVNLFAADPLLAKPIHMNFDARGRLWIASSETYPQIEPGKKANDKIIVLEDTDNDGKADKTTVFADGLFIPTGIEPGDGGVYVANSTELLHIAETKDGKAGATRVLLSGFGTEDTHHIIHSFRWGFDGNLYFNQSIYIHSHIETPYGVRRLNAGGIWQYRPETNRLEVFARGWVNSWGHHFDRWGQSFATDGAYGEGINYVLPGAYYVSAVGAGRILSGLNPGQPKQCGLEVVSGRHLPDDWQGNLITNDFRGHRVNRFALKEDGAAYLSQQMPDLIRSTHPAFRPIDVKMGPDGAIYIADWYNPIIQHGEVDFRDPRRDKTHGRIWRITAKGRPLVPKPKLVDATVPELLEHLKSPEDWTRHQAKRVLKERGVTEVLPKLTEWLLKPEYQSGGADHLMLELLWVYQSLDVVSPELLTTLLGSKDHRVRAAAVRVLSHWQHRINNPGKLMDEAIRDDHPRVRLEAVRASAAMPSLASAERAMKALDKPVDRWLDYALWLTARDLEQEWMTPLRDGQVPFGGNVRHLLFALQAVNSRDAVPTLVKLIQGKSLPADQELPVLKLLAGVGGAGEHGLIIDRALVDASSSPVQAAELLDALEPAARQRNVRPAGDLQRIRPLLSASSESLAMSAARLAGAWKAESLQRDLMALCRESKSTRLRQSRADALAEIGTPAAREALASFTTDGQPLELQHAAVLAIARIELNQAAAYAKTILPQLAVGDAATLFSAFLERKGGAALLAKALSGVKLPVDIAKVGMRTLRLSGTNSPELVAVLTQAGALAAPKRSLSADEMKQFIADVQAKGDPARGEAIFRRADMLCFKCHSIGGSGGQVGSDILSLGTSAQLEYIVDSVLLPNKNVKEGYNAVRIDLKDGKQVSGVKLRETPTEITLRDAEDREVVVPKNKIDDSANVGSLMPEGLIDPLTRDELLDLVRFLSELGKGPYSVGAARRVRTWQVLQATKEAYTPLTRVGMHAVAGNEPALTWTPAYSSVAGALALGELPRFELRKGFQDVKTPVGFTRFRLDVSAAGAARLKFDSVTGLQLWLDGTAVPLKTETTLDLSVGIHNVVIAIDLEHRRGPLAVELEDIANSPARVRLVGGK